MSNLDDISKSIYRSLVSTIRGSSRVAAQDISFYTGLDSSLNDERQVVSGRLLELASRIVQSVTPDEDPITDLENLQDRWKTTVISVLDTLFERTDMAIDNLNGRRTQIQIDAKAPYETRPKRLETTTTTPGKAIKYAKNIAKPQLKFARQIDNLSDRPFRPLLTSKPHALVPLEKSLELVSSDNSVEPYYDQPYAYEIMNQSYPELKVLDPVPFNDWMSTSAIYVDTVDKLDDMVDSLLECREIAVDLEHHDYRSYRGFVCLMQISNRKQDWIIDTLILRDELQVLNKVFANPNIVKVLHGAYMDIIWLQRDFGLYVVSLFDTYYATGALGLEKHSLAFLLEKYANFQASKQYQLADWRIRPLPEEMLQYARADTHFLLYIYDILRNELTKQDKLHVVLQESRQVAAKRYEVTGYGGGESDPLLNLLTKYRLSPSQQIVLKDLFAWRDQIARKLDDSPRYVMPNHYMVSLSVMMPTNVASVLSAGTGVTNLIRTYSKDIVAVIEAAKQKAERELDDTEMEDAESPSSDDSELDLIEDYDAYQQAFQKALKGQTKIFDQKVIKKTLKTLRAPVSHLYGKAEAHARLLVPMIASEDELRRRFDLIHHKVQLYIPAPEDEEESSSNVESMSESESEEENDVEEQQAEDQIGERDPSVEEASPPQKIVEKKQEVDMVFVGTKRKSEDNYDEIDLAVLPAKERRKIRRKKMRLIQRASQIAHLNGTDGTADWQQSKTKSQEAAVSSSKPFNALDLQNAKNVLETQESKAAKRAEEKKAAKAARAEKKKQNGEFNPYSSVDTPCEAKKTKHRTKGKTVTYKPKK